MTPIHFKPNEPQVLSLKEISGVIEGFNVLYETWDGKLLCLPRPAAIKLNELDPEPGEEFSATKMQANQKAPAEWVFSLTARSEQLRAEKQDLVSTAFISAAKSGVIMFDFEREAPHV